MAVLTQKTNFQAGDIVDADTVNDVVETALEAHKVAAEAKQYVGQTVGEFITQALNTEV